MMWQLVALTLLSTAAVIHGQCTQHVNGCSIPYQLPFFFKASFTPSCNRHDICYACGAHYGIARSTCDSHFLGDMRSTCATKGKRGLLSVAEKGFCNLISTDYWAAVRVGGSSHFSSGGEGFCGQSWARSCLGV